MGNILSSVWSGRAVPDSSNRETMDHADESENEECIDTIVQDEARVKAKEQEMAEFKKQLDAKREQRKEILSRHKNEKKELETSLDEERKAKLDAYETNRQLRELLVKNNIELPAHLKSAKEDTNISDTISNMKEEFERLRENNIKLRKSLAETTNALQNAYSDIADLQGENTESIKQISALKEVVKMSKTMISLREEQLTELKNKLNEIEQSLADREASMLSADLRNEYVRQLGNIRTLRNLYEERARLAEVTKQGLMRELEDQKSLTEAEEKRCNELKARVEELEAKVNEMLETVDTKNSEITASQSETHRLTNEMSVVNKLFSQVLLGYKNKQDLDKLVHRLEENHGLLTHMAEKENGSEASSALPKLLLELVSQIDEADDGKDKNQEVETTGPMEVESAEKIETSNTSTAEEIVENLPKVWRVLIELLSHQSASEENTSEKVTTCYKSVETKSGPVLVPSVSQTYIRLKDLILEKLSLVKEVNRMKQLNVHLESRLGEQERRLCLVTSELSKTWHVVGRLRRHHHQLHTHEKILKYELQQKRKLLNELKEELEYCREKWEQAREKNTQSERDWKKLRAEFTSRKKIETSFNNSAESGYSDERPSDESSESNDESEHVTEPHKRSKKKSKKSVENILDSSADFNLVAEREDPASDLLDVADLPLDTQDGDNSHDISDSCNSENLLKSERICEETEDEVGDIANDSCAEEASECSQDRSSPSQKQNLEEKADDANAGGDRTQIVSHVTTTDIPSIDPAAIMKSIRDQNERLAKKDKRLKKLEKTGDLLLKQTQHTVKFSEQISNALDHLLTRPTSSSQESQISNIKTTQQDNEDASPSKRLDYSEGSSNSTTTPSKTSVVADPAGILKDAIEQKQQLASIDDKIEHLTLLNKTEATAEINKNSCHTLDHLLQSHRPTLSAITENKVEETLEEGAVKRENGNFQESFQTTISNEPGSQDVNNACVMNSVINEGTSIAQDCVLRSADFKTIVENVTNQNETRAREDARLLKVETGCTILEKEAINIHNSDNDISHEDHQADADAAKTKVEFENELVEPSTTSDDVSDTTTVRPSTSDTHEIMSEIDEVETDETSSTNIDKNMVTLTKGDYERDPDSRESSELSTSSEMDHEARFAARDIRLKRLEEQTKSLVNKVNKTTSKGVKINYKLDELHNIYGSQGSRAGTPSEEDRSQNNEDENDDD